MNELEKNLRYSFRDRSLLEHALTHSSYANEHHLEGGSNERLEFLGDAVLSVIVADYLYRNYAHYPEGKLTKLRASLVCEKTLCRFSKELDLGRFLRFGKGEAADGGCERPSILADAFESVLAAMYLDGGMDVARTHVLRFVCDELTNQELELFKDYKTTLQEVIQRNPEERLTYVLIAESGPDHDKFFTVEVHLNTNVIGTGTGKTKKNAEQMAAKDALSLMGL